MLFFGCVSFEQAYLPPQDQVNTSLAFGSVPSTDILAFNGGITDDFTEDKGWWESEDKKITLFYYNGNLEVWYGGTNPVYEPVYRDFNPLDIYNAPRLNIKARSENKSDFRMYLMLKDEKDNEITLSGQSVSDSSGTLFSFDIRNLKEKCAGFNPERVNYLGMFFIPEDPSSEYKGKFFVDKIYPVPYATE